MNSKQPVENTDDEPLSEETMQGFMTDAIDCGMFERFGSPEIRAQAKLEKQRREECE